MAMGTCDVSLRVQLVLGLLVASRANLSGGHPPVDHIHPAAFFELGFGASESSRLDLLGSVGQAVFLFPSGEIVILRETYLVFGDDGTGLVSPVVFLVAVAERCELDFPNCLFPARRTLFLVTFVSFGISPGLGILIQEVYAGIVPESQSIAHSEIETYCGAPLAVFMIRLIYLVLILVTCHHQVNSVSFEH